MIQVTLLVRSADTKSLLINIDQQLLMSLKEAEYMLMNSFEVPESSKALLHTKDKLKGECSYFTVDYTTISSTLCNV